MNEKVTNFIEKIRTHQKLAGRYAKCMDRMQLLNVRVKNGLHDSDRELSA